MFRTLTPREAESILAIGGVDVVDVREPHEFAAGHLPGARNVPLADLKADSRAAFPSEHILLVCARGVRSQTAAKLASELGWSDVLQLDGGTHAWTAAGLPLERPATARSDKRATIPPPMDVSCGLPDPGLEAVVGKNLRELRRSRGVTLDEVARRTGLSRTVLGQIELGKTSPSVGVVWQVAQTFAVPFSALLVGADSDRTQVHRSGDARRLATPDGRFSSRPLFTPGELPVVEFYELFLAGHSREDAEPHPRGTRENLIVGSGQLELDVGDERFELGRGDSIVFRADVRHAYVNPRSAECWMYLVMTYAPPER